MSLSHKRIKEAVAGDHTAAAVAKDHTPRPSSSPGVGDRDAAAARRHAFPARQNRKEFPVHGGQMSPRGKGREGKGRGVVRSKSSIQRASSVAWTHHELPPPRGSGPHSPNKSPQLAVSSPSLSLSTFSLLRHSRVLSSSSSSKHTSLPHSLAHSPQSILPALRARALGVWRSLAALP
ncbi:hypothetical protein GQ55_7G041800 [Panicum hallii var. hallii]|uniref:Uncharacterized protein n=1 Tax=Panicum hallii var. hallii TaxID=1504633 RepID=A0A2T7CSE1_9POAL|nr:hypothetical protein GQ55_7G041800 [Panicum hallii var. hallii]